MNATMKAIALSTLVLTANVAQAIPVEVKTIFQSMSAEDQTKMFHVVESVSNKDSKQFNSVFRLSTGERIAFGAGQIGKVNNQVCRSFIVALSTGAEAEGKMCDISTKGEKPSWIFLDN
jgi:hypothetical protein